ncbi:MAG: hypothetical protein US50_C0032G0002 [Candidatus Nomurabacteria bacterium GW2011_GWB1_37_5]|uniref:Uncharacterized protein n=1 Tax=Candidatus Nomurabacteria bacterium GW2011_GWB1_37_5 TaxID=1618742 RepID=A0A0G0GV41_9BACT|nr:MAG: hypothetical protein US50_C0032G0002 [Candidatus Nomurabacteria bacterium GW2011_GWB1_37_5]
MNAVLITLALIAIAIVVIIRKGNRKIFKKLHDEILKSDWGRMDAGFDLMDDVSYSLYLSSKQKNKLHKLYKTTIYTSLVRYVISCKTFVDVYNLFGVRTDTDYKSHLFVLHGRDIRSRVINEEVGRILRLIKPDHESVIKKLSYKDAVQLLEYVQKLYDWSRNENLKECAKNIEFTCYYITKDEFEKSCRNISCLSELYERLFITQELKDKISVEMRKLAQEIISEAGGKEKAKEIKLACAFI